MKFVLLFLAQCLWYRSMSLNGEESESKRSKIGKVAKIQKISPQIFQWTKNGEKGYRSTKSNQADTLKNFNTTYKFSGIRPSLFPNVPPYYKFILYNEILDPWPQLVQKHLTWEKNSIDSKIIMKTITNSGFVLSSEKWNYPWDKFVKKNVTVKSGQKLNQTPGSRQVDNKAKLWVNLNASIGRYGKDVYDFVPATFLLPNETQQFRKAWDAKNCDNANCLWIVKPPHKANGDGIQVITKWSQIQNNTKFLVVQEYIKPFLVKRKKFDLRLYVFVTNFRPLRAYFYKDGLVRFAVTPYSNDTRKVNRLNMHLTNRAINRKSSRYVKNDNIDGTAASEWSVQTLWRYLKKRGFNTNRTISKIEDLIIKTLISVEPSVMLFTTQVPNRYSSYQLYGFDVGIDENLKPWLFEVNVSPGMGVNSGFLLQLKSKLITEHFNIAGYHFPASLSQLAEEKLKDRLWPNVTVTSVKYDGKMYQNKTCLETKRKHKAFTKINLKRSSYLEPILKNLTADDLRELVTAEDELTQCDGFTRIFPTHRTHRYLQYFAMPHYHNLLLDAWEYKYGGGKNRTEGIARLQEACQAKLHLK